MVDLRTDRPRSQQSQVARLAQYLVQSLGAGRVETPTAVAFGNGHRPRR